MSAGSEEDHFDLVVLGSGPAGEKGAAKAAYHGKRVAIVERSRNVGGMAVATGGIPTKALRETALQVSGLRRNEADGVTVTLDADAVFERLRIRSGTVSTVMSDAVSRNIANHGIELIHGRGRLEPNRRVVVDCDGRRRRVLNADVVLLATGSHPLRPDDIPFDGDAVLDSDEILGLDRPFESIAVIGAGPVGCEYASIFAAIGIKVWLIDLSEQLLPLLDVEIAKLLGASLRTNGIALLLGTGVKGIDHEGAGLAVELAGGRVLHVEKLLSVAGRIGNTDDLGLEEAGVMVDSAHRVVVDEHYRTTADQIFAAGDVIGPPGLASASMEQARVAMCHAFGFPLYPAAVDRLLPVGIYTIPEVASVGMTEEAATRAGLDHEVGRGWFEKNTRAVISGDIEGMVKLVFERKGGRLLGVHILGADAAELVHHGQAVLRHGGDIGEFIHTTFNVPTRSSAYKDAAYDGMRRMDVRAAFGDAS